MIDIGGPGLTIPNAALVALAREPRHNKLGGLETS